MAGMVRIGDLASARIGDREDGTRCSMESPQLQRVFGGATVLGVVAWALEWGPFSKTKYDRVSERRRSKKTGRFARK